MTPRSRVLQHRGKQHSGLPGCGRSARHACTLHMLFYKGKLRGRRGAGHALARLPSMCSSSPVTGGGGGKPCVATREDGSIVVWTSFFRGPASSVNVGWSNLGG